jgi:hypothetical protein
MQPGNLQDPQTSSARKILRCSINNVIQQQSAQMITLLAAWQGLGAYVSGVVHRMYMANDLFPHCSGLPHCMVSYYVAFLLKNGLEALIFVHHRHIAVINIFRAINSYPHHPQLVTETSCGFFTILHCNKFSAKHT